MCKHCENGLPLWKSRVECISIGKHPQKNTPAMKIGRFYLDIDFCPKCGRKIAEA